MSNIREYFRLKFILIMFAFSSVSILVSSLSAQEGTTPPTAVPQLPAAEWSMVDESVLNASPEIMAELNELRELVTTQEGPAREVGQQTGGFDGYSPFGYEDVPELNSEELIFVPPTAMYTQEPMTWGGDYSNVFSSGPMTIGVMPIYEISEDQLNSRQAKRHRIELMLSNLLNADLPGHKALTLMDYTLSGNPPVVIDEVGGQIVSSPSSIEIAIAGEGFLRIRSMDYDGVQYTRCGQLFSTDDGELGVLIRDVTYPLDPPISILSRSGDLFITPRGEVIRMPGQNNDVASQPIILGNIQLAQFACYMKAIGICRYVPNDPSCEEQIGAPGEDGLGRIRPFAYEKSNVDVEATKQALIEAIEAYRP